MRIVDDAVEDGVGVGRLTDHVVPGAYRDLSGDQRGFRAVALFEDFEQVEALLIGQAMGAPVIQDEQIDPGKPVDKPREASIKASQRKILEQARHAQIEDRVVKPGCLPAEGAAEPGFPGGGLAGDDQILMSLELCPLCEREDIAPVEPALGGKVDIFDTGIGKAQPRRLQPVGEAAVGTNRDFTIEHQSEPFLTGKIAAIVLHGDVAPGGSHSRQAKRLHLVEGRMVQHGIAFLH